MKAYITSYQYDGAHRNYDPRRGWFYDDHEHFDWRYRIVVGGLTIYHRYGFCSWESAMRSLTVAWSKVDAALGEHEKEMTGVE